jgi:histidine ammonia-lyase
MGQQTLVEMDRELSCGSANVVLSGGPLALPEVLAVARHDARVDFTEDPAVRTRLADCHEHMLANIRDGVPIYGCNTFYGARAATRADTASAAQRLETARAISSGLAFVDVGVGPVFPKEVVRGAMLIRVNMLLHGVSAVKLADLDLYRRLLNGRITPVVSQYGGLGASGDLAHNGRVLSVLRQLDGAQVWDRAGQVCDAAEVLGDEGIPTLELDPKAGLGLTNGDNFSSSLAVHIAADTLETLLLAGVLGAMMVEVLRGSTRSFHPLLDTVRPHAGQREVAALYRYLLAGSRLAYQEMTGHQPREPGVSVQDGYCLRGISQYHGVNFEKVQSALAILTTNISSVSDNPLWVAPEFATPGEAPWQWVSGANFLAMHVAEVLDGLRKVLTQIVKLNDRHLARLVNPQQNNGLPPNLSDPAAVTQCTFKGVQIQAGMFDVYSSLLSIPVTTFFGVHEEGNQDITAHSLTSGILALENLRLARYSLAQNLLAIAQAVDLRGGPSKLSPRTQPVYRFVRERAAYVKEERPLHRDIEGLYQTLTNGELATLVRAEVLAEFGSAMGRQGQYSVRGTQYWVLCTDSAHPTAALPVRRAVSGNRGGTGSGRGPDRSRDGLTFPDCGNARLP